MVLLPDLQEKTLVSIITVSLNSEETIEKTIESVKGQTYHNIEYFIIDGQSQDGTLDIVKSYNECVTKFISEKDDGLYDAMNKGIGFSNGELIGILNSDDWYEKDAVEKVVKAWLDNGKPDIVHGDILMFFPIKRQTKRMKPRRGLKAKVTTPFNHPACFVKNSLYSRIGGYDRGFRIAGDYDFMLRAIKSKSNVHYLEKIITNVRSDGLSTKTPSSLRVRERSKALIKNDYGIRWIIFIYLRFLFAQFGRNVFYRLS